VTTENVTQPKYSIDNAFFRRRMPEYTKQTPGIMIQTKAAEVNVQEISPGL
jgi:hypothetical protein